MTLLSSQVMMKANSNTNTNSQIDVHVDVEQLAGATTAQLDRIWIDLVRKEIKTLLDIIDSAEHRMESDTNVVEVQLPRCTCHAAEDFKKHNSLMKLMQFLMGLDDSYMQIRSNILSRDPLPDVRGAYAVISSEESHRVRPPNSGNSSRNNNGSRPSGGGNRRTNGGSQLGIQNFNRRFINHNSVGSSNSSTFSDDQLSKIISLIKDNSLNNGKGVQANMAAGVIVDSGANQHLTYTDKDLREMKVLGTVPGPSDGLRFHPIVFFSSGSGLTADSSVLTLTLAFLDFGLDFAQSFPFHAQFCHFGLVHLDLWGPYKVSSKEGFRFFLTIVDDYTRSVWVYMLKGKDEVFDCVLTFYNLIKNQFNKVVKAFRSDNGTEFVNQKFSKFCAENGIIHQTTCAYTPQQNGIVERKHRHLLNVARSLLFQGGLPLNLWSECIMTAAYLINRLPSSVLNGKSPFELVFDRKPGLKHLRVFGCLCYATVLNLHDKFGSRAEKCVLVGYASFKKGYKLYSLERKQFIYSRDVRFFEKVFPFKIRQPQDMNLACQDLDHVNFFDEIVYENPDTSNDDHNKNARDQSDGSNSPVTSSSTFDQNVNDLGHSQGSNGSASEDEMAATFDPTTTNSEDDVVASEPISDSVPTTSAPHVRRSERSSVFPKRYNDFVVDSKVKYGLENYVSYVNLSTVNRCFTTELNKSFEPKSFYEASKDQHWIEAMNNEMNALYSNDTWEVVELPL
ncbi:putative RNA-directed DNA polymerase, partial [Tanacetum coccineum]